MNLKYVAVEKHDINKLLTTTFIQFIKEIVISNYCGRKKNGKWKIYVGFKKLSATTKKNPHPLPFTNEMLYTIAWHDVYSFLDGYSSCYQIFITRKDNMKQSFVTNLGAFTWVVMHFGAKNGPPTH